MSKTFVVQNVRSCRNYGILRHRSEKFAIDIEVVSFSYVFLSNAYKYVLLFSDQTNVLKLHVQAFKTTL